MSPFRVRSNGRQARAGSSLYVDVALITSKQTSVIGEIGASLPPVTTTSAVPSWISSAAYPTASMPDVHPVEITAAGPSAPVSVATAAAIELGRKYSYRWG